MANAKPKKHVMDAGAIKLAEARIQLAKARDDPSRAREVTTLERIVKNFETAYAKARA